MFIVKENGRETSVHVYESNEDIWHSISLLELSQQSVVPIEEKVPHPALKILAKC